MRELIDDRGRVWRLYERSSCHGVAAAGSCLIAETEDLVRRFAVYPDDWASMSVESLIALINGPVRNRSTGGVTAASTIRQRDAGSSADRSSSDWGRERHDRD